MATQRVRRMGTTKGSGKKLVTLITKLIKLTKVGIIGKVTTPQAKNTGLLTHGMIGKKWEEKARKREDLVLMTGLGGMMAKMIIVITMDHIIMELSTMENPIIHGLKVVFTSPESSTTHVF